LHLLAACTAWTGLHTAYLALLAIAQLSPLGVIKGIFAAAGAYVFGFVLTIAVWSLGVLAWRNALKVVARRLPASSQDAF
jgi:hypothetical protein